MNGLIYDKDKDHLYIWADSSGIVVLNGTSLDFIICISWNLGYTIDGHIAKPIATCVVSVTQHNRKTLIIGLDAIASGDNYNYWYDDVGIAYNEVEEYGHGNILLVDVEDVLNYVVKPTWKGHLYGVRGLAVYNNKKVYSYSRGQIPYTDNILVWKLNTSCPNGHPLFEIPLYSEGNTNRIYTINDIQPINHILIVVCNCSSLLLTVLI